jgi:hypothetical protein
MKYVLLTVLVCMVLDLAVKFIDCRRKKYGKRG